MNDASHAFAAATRRFRPVISSVTCFALMSCANVEPGMRSEPTGLAGTAWRLVSFQTTQSKAEALRPSRADQFQLQFNADGRLLARLDCNRGSGSWQAPADGGAAGSLRIGPLASTKMMCPPDPLAARLPADVESVRRYRIDGDRLILESETGTYSWERAARLDGK